MRLIVLLTALLVAASARAQFDFSDVTYMANMQVVSGGGGGGDTNLLLDIYTTSRSNGFSLIKLSTNSTLCIRVRRATDNATNDIGFSGTNIDTNTLATFCGTTNGFILRWYSQPFTGDYVTHPTAGNQPKIYDGSTGVIRADDNHLPAIQFTQGSSQVLLSLTSNNFNPSLSYYAVASRNWSKQTNAAWPCVWAMAISSNPGKALIQVGNNFGEATAGDICSWGDGYDAAGRNPRAIGIPTAGFLNSTNDTHTWLFSGVDAASGTAVRLNGTAMSYRQRGDAALTSQALQFSIGGSVADGDFFDYKIQSVIMFAANHDGTTNQTGIESSLKTYYGLQ